MKELFERLGWAALLRRIWPSALVDFRIDGDEPGCGSDPLSGVHEPRPGPLGGRSAGAEIEEPHDVPLAVAIGRRSVR